MESEESFFITLYLQIMFPSEPPFEHKTDRDDDNIYIFYKKKIRSFYSPFAEQNRTWKNSAKFFSIIKRKCIGS